MVDELARRTLLTPDHPSMGNEGNLAGARDRIEFVHSLIPFVLPSIPLALD
jgi:hypothetical protein